MIMLEGSEVEAQQVRESESALLRLNLTLLRMLIQVHPELTGQAGQALRETRCRILDYELGSKWDREVRALIADVPALAPIVGLPC